MSEGPAVPFGQAATPRSLGDGTFTATLRSEWSVGGHPHGGFITALLARAAGNALAEPAGPEAASSSGGDPLSVNADFLRPAELGPALLRTSVRKVGRQTSVVAVRLEQRGRSCVEAHVTTGRMPEQPVVWADLPVLAPEPPVDAVAVAEVLGNGVFRLAADCEVWVDPSTAGPAAKRVARRAASAKAAARMRLWARPRSEATDVYFALLAGDINPPVPLNLGRSGWSPTVQLTSYARSRPAPGWLRVDVDCRAVYGDWFDSSATVLDSAGRLVCQARQLAISPAPA